MNRGLPLDLVILLAIIGLVIYYIWFYSYNKYINKNKIIKNINELDVNDKNINIFETKNESVQIINENKVSNSELPPNFKWGDIVKEINEQSLEVQQKNTLDQLLDDHNIDLN